VSSFSLPAFLRRERQPKNAPEAVPPRASLTRPHLLNSPRVASPDAIPAKGVIKDFLWESASLSLLQVLCDALPRLQQLPVVRLPLRIALAGAERIEFGRAPEIARGFEEGGARALAPRSFPGRPIGDNTPSRAGDRAVPIPP
jgi:hypothetical protein